MSEIQRPRPAFPRALSTTGIGSLPHSQLEMAMQQAFAVDIPFLPQLPAKNAAELMIAQAVDGLPGLRFDEEGGATVSLEEWKRGAPDLGRRLARAIEGTELSHFEPTPASYRAWKPFLWEIEERRAPYAKAQLAGPMTVRWVLKSGDGKSLAQLPELDAQVYRLVLARSLAMVRAVKEAGSQPLFFIDEPGLYAFDRRDPHRLMMLQELKLMVLALQKEGALVGLHCCSNTDWPALFGLGLNIVSLDARLSLQLAVAQPEFKRFVEQGGALALGIVPTDLRSDEDVEALVTGAKSLLGPEVYARALLTPACGLALRSVRDCERIFQQLKDAQALLRGAASS